MDIRRFFSRQRPEAPVTTVTLQARATATGVRAAIPAEHVEVVARAMRYRREWTCTCGAQLRIRGRDARRDGPSNFVAFPPGHKKAGHSQVQSSDLTWNGLAEERGWKVDGDTVVCPACQEGLTVSQFRIARAEGVL